MSTSQAFNKLTKINGQNFVQVRSEFEEWTRACNMYEILVRPRIVDPANQNATIAVPEPRPPTGARPPVPATPTMPAANVDRAHADWATFEYEKEAQALALPAWREHVDWSNNVKNVT